MTPADKKREYARRWKARNRERIAAYMREWRSKHATHIREYDKKTSAKRYARTNEWRRQNRPHLREYATAYYSANRASIRAQIRDRYRNDPDFRQRIRSENRMYYVTHRDAVTEYAKKWRADHPDKAYEISRRGVLKRRAALATVAGNFTFDGFISRCEYFGWRCRYCHASLDIGTVSLDHQIPLSRNGTNWLSNCVPACLSCNKRKNAKKPSEFHAIIASAPVDINVPSPGVPESTRRLSRGPM